MAPSLRSHVIAEHSANLLTFKSHDVFCHSCLLHSGYLTKVQDLISEIILALQIQILTRTFLLLRMIRRRSSNSFTPVLDSLIERFQDLLDYIFEQHYQVPELADPFVLSDLAAEVLQVTWGTRTSLAH